MAAPSHKGWTPVFGAPGVYLNAKNNLVDKNGRPVYVIYKGEHQVGYGYNPNDGSKVVFPFAKSAQPTAPPSAPASQPSAPAAPTRPPAVATAPSGYVNPLPNGATKKRPDRGRDFQGKPGDPVVAVGRARVDAVKSDPGGYGKVVYYTLLDGPYKGQQIFVGHAAPTVNLRDMLAAGQQIATLQQVSGGDARNLPGWVEIGFAKGGQPQYGKTQGGKYIDRLLAGARPLSMALSTAAANQTSTTAPADLAAPVDPAALAVTAPVATPPPTALGVPQPDVQLPGSVNYTIDPKRDDTAALWGQVAQGDFVSPETQAMLRNAQLSVGGQ